MSEETNQNRSRNARPNQQKYNRFDVPPQHKGKVSDLFSKVKSMGYNISFYDCYECLKECGFATDRALDSIISGVYKPWKFNPSKAYGKHEQAKRNHMRKVPIVFRPEADEIEDAIEVEPEMNIEIEEPKEEPKQQEEKEKVQKKAPKNTEGKKSKRSNAHTKDAAKAEEPQKAEPVVEEKKVEETKPQPPKEEPKEAVEEVIDIHIDIEPEPQPEPEQPKEVQQPQEPEKPAPVKVEKPQKTEQDATPVVAPGLNQMPVQMPYGAMPPYGYPMMMMLGPNGQMMPMQMMGGMVPMGMPMQMPQTFNNQQVQYVPVYCIPQSQK